ncbi:hypothetical protein N300_13236, partial [Calypte anna]
TASSLRPLLRHHHRVVPFSLLLFFVLPHHCHLRTSHLSLQEAGIVTKVRAG